VVALMEGRALASRIFAGEVCIPPEDRIARGSSVTSMRESLEEREPRALLERRGTYAGCLVMSLADGSRGKDGIAFAVIGRRLLPQDKHWCIFIGRVIKAALSNEVPYCAHSHDNTER